MFLKLLDQRGISLVQVMMAAGMMGALALAFTRIVEDQNRSVALLQTKNDELELHRQVTIFLTNPENCRSSITQVEGEVNALVTPTGREFLKNGQLFGDRSVRINSMSVRNDETSGVSSSGGRGALVLTINTTRAKKILKGNTQRAKEIMIQVNADSSGRVTDCYSLNNSVIETSVSQACISLGGQVNEVGLCERPSHTLTQMCQALGLSYNASSGKCFSPSYTGCSDGTVVQGLNSSGELTTICLTGQQGSVVGNTNTEASGPTQRECSSCGGANCSPDPCPSGTSQVSLSCTNGEVCGTYNGNQITNRICIRRCQ